MMHVFLPNVNFQVFQRFLRITCVVVLHKNEPSCWSIIGIWSPVSPGAGRNRGEWNEPCKLWDPRIVPWVTPSNNSEQALRSWIGGLWSIFGSWLCPRLWCAAPWQTSFEVMIASFPNEYVDKNILYMLILKIQWSGLGMCQCMLHCISRPISQDYSVSTKIRLIISFIIQVKQIKEQLETILSWIPPTIASLELDNRFVKFCCPCWVAVNLIRCCCDRLCEVGVQGLSSRVPWCSCWDPAWQRWASPRCAWASFQCLGLGWVWLKRLRSMMFFVLER